MNGIDKNMQTKWLDALWLRMSALYPAWNSMIGLHPYVLDENGKPTNELNSKGQVWSEELAKLTGDELKIGFESLKTRSEKNYPPSVFEFKELCLGSEFETTLDSILCRIDEGENYIWNDQVSFNLWIKYSFDFLSCHKHELPKLIKQNLKFIVKDSMFPLPDYSVKAIEKPKEPTKEQKIKEQVKQRFLGALHFVITFLNIPYPDPIKEKLDANRGEDVVNQFLEQGYQIPDLPVTEGLTDKEIKLKKDHVKFVYRGAIQKFVEGVLS